MATQRAPVMANAVQQASGHGGFKRLVEEVAGEIERLLSQNAYIAGKQYELRAVVEKGLAVPSGAEVDWTPMLTRFVVLALISYFDMHREELQAAYPRAASATVLTAAEQREALAKVADLWRVDSAHDELLRNKVAALEAHFQSVAARAGLSAADAPEVAFVLHRLPDRSEVMRAATMQRLRALVLNEDSPYHGTVGIEPLLRFMSPHNQFNYVKWGAQATPPVAPHRAFLTKVVALTNMVIARIVGVRADGHAVTAEYVYAEFREVIAMVLLAGLLERNLRAVHQVFGLDELLDAPSSSAVPVGGVMAGGCHGGHGRRR